MTGETSVRIAPGRLWAGGGSTALVAALAAIVVVLVAHGLFDVPVLAPFGEGAWGGIGTVAYAVSAAIAALAATGLLHLLLITTPRGRSFFISIMLLVTAIAVVVPLGLDADRGARFATAAGNLLIGVVITGTLSSVARASVRVSRPLR
ncbi:DUF6069 family protein [Amycolatopsis rhabdoformis]|uniref:DUF6069 family protein n=1 Tax=Amycolatopsis rhabdoformis TaxID=1448059 RepID=A0ABZ1IFD2_9PSEU|nr:DUF6069 family protein [Amycolatopsis rhabdoformis]WSE32254.1 DUF6069 family protein [Amycolatopsis rhabdoformis]